MSKWCYEEASETIMCVCWCAEGEHPNGMHECECGYMWEVKSEAHTGEPGS